MSEILLNTKYQIKTPNGYKDFYGIRKVEHADIVSLTFSDNTAIKCSIDHPFISDGRPIYAHELSSGCVIDSIDGNKTLIDIECKTNKSILYDIVEVDDGNIFIANDLITHNCDFLSSGHSVIEGEIIQWYDQNTVTDPLERRGMDGDYWIWKYPDYTRSYIVTCDPARGDGADDSAIEVFDIESMEQVAEYIGKVTPRDLGKMAVSIATDYNKALLVVENKNIGYDTVQEAIDLQYSNIYYSYRSDLYVDPIKHISKGYDLKNKKDMVPGFTTTTANRPMIVSKLERYFSEKSITIHSKRLTSQLLVFVWLNGKAQARHGRKDDAVMATGITLFVRDTALKLQEMGIDLTKKALTHIHKRVYTPNASNSDAWTMKDARGNIISTKWLL